jgi:hypothetical protein
MRSEGAPGARRGEQEGCSPSYRRGATQPTVRSYRVKDPLNADPDPTFTSMRIRIQLLFKAKL